MSRCINCLHYIFIFISSGPGELPRQHQQQPGQYFVVVYKNIFTFKGKPTIELNYVFDMHADSHAEGCGSEYVPMGRDHSEVQDSFLPELGDKPNHPKTYVSEAKVWGQKADLSILSIFLVRKVAMDHVRDGG